MAAVARQVASKDSSGVRIDPLRGYKFGITDSAGGLQCGFNKVSGLSEESEIAEYRDGCDPVTMRKFPGLVSFENIMLERGLSVAGDLLDWREQVVRSITNGGMATTLIPHVDGLVDGKPQGDTSFRRTLFIDLYDRGSSTIQRSWEVLEAWPCKLDDGELDASSSDVVIESAEICHEGLKRGFLGGTTSPLRSGSF